MEVINNLVDGFTFMVHKGPSILRKNRTLFAEAIK
jgi:hypothetical protein